MRRHIDIGLFFYFLNYLTSSQLPKVLDLLVREYSRVATVVVVGVV